MTDRTPSPPSAASRAAETLRRRARALAAPVRLAADRDQDRLLVFRRGAERFGVPLARVAATFSASITPLPGADAPARAVVAWRSRPLAVYDLAAHAAPLPDVARLVVLGDWGRAVALLADEIEDAFGADAGVATRAANTPLVRAVTADAVAVLDVDAVLSLFDDPR